MKVIFDYEIFSIQTFGGISRYFVELARAMEKKSVDVRILAPYFINKYLDRKKDPVSSFLLPFLIKNRFYNLSLLVNNKYTKWYIKHHNVDIIHQTYFFHTTLNENIKRVITIHDMIYELNPDLPFAQKFINYKRNAINSADHIIAISESTKRDLLYFYPEFEKKVTVVYHGLNKFSSITGKYVSERPYLLFVGHRGFYKNFSLLLNVFSQDKSLHEKYNLICFGGENDFNESEHTKIKSLGLENIILHISGGDEILNSLYNSATLFIYPSKYEGFGLPVLESMAAGCPVLCSDSSSLPEVGGDAVFYFDAKSEDSLKSSLWSALNDPLAREQKIKMGFIQITKFTWEKCAEETLMVYQKVLERF